jgi:hypothetical protein
MREPTLSPAEALQRLVDNNHQDFEHDGFKYISDGPMMSPPSEWTPFASEDEDKGSWYTHEDRWIYYSFSGE